MRTRNSHYPNNSPVTIPRRQNKRHALNVAEPELRTIVEVAPMAEQTMEELLQAPHGRTNLLQLVQSNPFHGFEKENPHTHINNFKRITKTLKFKDVLNDVIKLMMFPYSPEGAARVWVKSTSRESSSKTDEIIDKLAYQILTLVEIVTKKVVTPATVKAVDESCVICGDNHAYYNCNATDSNQSSVCAATGAYNQVAPPNRASNQMAPPGFAPMQNSQNRFNRNQGNNFNRGNNFHVQQGIPNEFSSYMKSNESMMRNMQSQINELRGNFSKQEESLRRNLNNDMRSILGSFFQNQASTLGTLPSNTIPNPKGEMKAITTRSGVAYEGPSIPTNPSSKKVVERETEETTDKKQTNFQGSTAHIQPPVILIPILKPNVLRNLPKPNIPYPSRLN
ncbi:hypothetical protein Tco_0948261 [Tanacetum coccineum]